MSTPMKIKAKDDRRIRTLKIAYNSILGDADDIKEYASRYHLDPDKWPELESKHKKYVAYIDAMDCIEDMLKVKQGVFNI